jgi:hypothetical protein
MAPTSAQNLSPRTKQHNRYLELANSMTSEVKAREGSSSASELDPAHKVYLLNAFAAKL